jgi:hypothetical protein
MASTEVGGSLAGLIGKLSELWFKNYTVRKNQAWWDEDWLRLRGVPIRAKREKTGATPVHE